MPMYQIRKLVGDNTIQGSVIQGQSVVIAADTELEARVQGAAALDTDRVSVEEIPGT